MQNTKNKVDVVHHQCRVESPRLMHQHLTAESDIYVSSYDATSSVKSLCPGLRGEGQSITRQVAGTQLDTSVIKALSVSLQERETKRGRALKSVLGIPV